MIKKTLIAGALLCTALIMPICMWILAPERASPALALSCRANVYFAINQDATTTTMDGQVSLVTLGKSRLAMQFSGQMTTPEGRFLLNRVLMMTYHYHPENQALELNYSHSNVSETDNIPDSVFYQRLVKNPALLLYLQRFNHDSWLVSGLNMPLYICTDR